MFGWPGLVARGVYSSSCFSCPHLAHTLYLPLAVTRVRLYCLGIVGLLCRPVWLAGRLGCCSHHGDVLDHLCHLLRCLHNHIDVVVHSDGGWLCGGRSWSLSPDHPDCWSLLALALPVRATRVAYVAHPIWAEGLPAKLTSWLHQATVPTNLADDGGVYWVQGWRCIPCAVAFTHFVCLLSCEQRRPSQPPLW